MKREAQVFALFFLWNLLIIGIAALWVNIALEVISPIAGDLAAGVTIGVVSVCLILLMVPVTIWSLLQPGRYDIEEAVA